MIVRDDAVRTLRLDESGWRDLLAAAEDYPTATVEAVLAGAAPWVEALVGAMASAVLSLEVTVVGPRRSQRHRIWVGPRTAALLLAVDADRWQLMGADPAFVTAALVRLTRLRPRRPAPDRDAVRLSPATAERLGSPDPAVLSAVVTDLAADVIWSVRVHSSSYDGVLTVVDRAGGLFLTEGHRLRPTTPTDVYRILSTALRVAA